MENPLIEIGYADEGYEVELTEAIDWDAEVAAACLAQLIITVSHRDDIDPGTFQAECMKALMSAANAEPQGELPEDAAR